MSAHQEVRSEYIHTGPEDNSVLRLQNSHRGYAVWLRQGDDSTPLICKRAGRSVLSQDPDVRIITYLRSTGFYGTSILGYYPLDHHLITALVERWRPETHTFHMPVGECGISLQDIAVLSGLPTDGEAVIGSSHMDWDDLCLRLLGRVPQPGPHSGRKGARLSLKWLEEEFDEIPVNADANTIQQHARAYILRLIGGVVFPDRSGAFVHMMFLALLEDLTRRYSWGSACLAWLYRELCKAAHFQSKQIGGALVFLQFWAWDRINYIAPSIIDPEPVHAIPYGCRWSRALCHTEITSHSLIHLRYLLDRMSPRNFIWEPYTESVLETLPGYCLQGRQTWSAVVPLICFYVIEWHHTDRFTRQFGIYPSVPNPALQTDDLHNMDLRQTDSNWETLHARWVVIWNNRAQYVLHGQPYTIPLHHHSEYMEWYRRITQRWISPPGATVGVLEDGLEHLHIAYARSDLPEIGRLLHSMSSTIYEEQRRVEQSRLQRAAPPPTIPLISGCAVTIDSMKHEIYF